MNKKRSCFHVFIKTCTKFYLFCSLSNKKQIDMLVNQVLLIVSSVIIELFFSRKSLTIKAFKLHRINLILNNSVFILKYIFYKFKFLSFHFTSKI